MYGLKCVVLLVYLSTSVYGQFCHVKMLRPSGIVFYPVRREQTLGQAAPNWWRHHVQNECMLYMEMDREKRIKLVFRHVDVGTNGILVEAAKTNQTDSWRTLKKITGNHVEVIVETTNVTALRIITEQNAGRFFLFYQEFYCVEPDLNMLIKKTCSNSYEKFSICEFYCRKPAYYPMRFHVESFSTACKHDKTWSWDIREYCFTYKQLIKLCLIEFSRLCDYSLAEIAKLIPEDDDIPLKHENFAKLELNARIAFLRKSLPVSSNDLLEMPEFNQCHVHCLKTKSTDAFKYECKSTDITALQMEDCILCRYSGDECSNHTLYD